MPVWLVILICLPPVLWLAYCLLKWSWGLPACLHCMLSWVALPLLLGAWLVWHGWSQQLMPPLVIGATILVCAAVIAGIVFLAFRFGGRSRELRREAAADAALVGTAAVAAPLAAGAMRQGEDSVTAAEGPGDIDVDAGGIDI